LISLLTVTIGSLSFEFIQTTPILNNIITFLKTYTLPTSIISIILGFFLFYRNRETIDLEIEKEELEEKRDEQTRLAEFPTKFPKINKIPVLRRLVKWGYKTGPSYIILIFLILILFTAIKAPHFDKSFTGEHSTKYMAIAESAINKYKNNDPFLQQLKYRVDPVNNPEGIYKTFNPPLNEWGLLATFYLMPDNSFEFNTRFFTNLTGVVILILAFIFLSKWINKKYALFAVFLMSINPILNFTSFVTVEDSWLIIFTFLALIFVTNYIKKDRIIDLYWAGIILGMGITDKTSIFLWLFPMIFLFLLLFKKTTLPQFIKEILIVTVTSFLVFISFKTSLTRLPSEKFLSILKFGIWILLFFAFYYLIKKINTIKIISHIIKNKKILLLSIILSILSLLIFIKFLKIDQQFNGFLTDSKLILNFNMYEYMLNKQFKNYITPNVFYLSIIGIITTIIIKNKKIKKLFFIFIFSSLFFWIIAPKPIFFHSYYTNIIMISLCLSGSFIIYCIYSIRDKNNNLMFKYFFIILISILIIPHSIETTFYKLNKEEDLYHLNMVNTFIKNNMESDEIWIDELWDYRYITLMTGIPQTNIEQLKQDAIINDIHKMGFKGGLNKYKVKYLITKNKTPLYENFIPLFNQSYEKNLPKIERTDLILSITNGIELPKGEFLEIESILNKYKIKEKFKLEKEFGDYRIYSFSD
jgi:hypothetical protein